MQFGQALPRRTSSADRRSSRSNTPQTRNYLKPTRSSSAVARRHPRTRQTPTPTGENKNNGNGQRLTSELLSQHEEPLYGKPPLNPRETATQTPEPGQAAAAAARNHDGWTSVPRSRDVSPARFGMLSGDQCSIYRPSPAHMEKRCHVPDPNGPGITGCCNDSPARHSHCSNTNNVNGRPMSTTSWADSVHSVGARDILRYRSRLKAQSPSALAVEADLQKWEQDKAEEKAAQLAYRERWRQSVEEQLAAKAKRKEEERLKGKSERVAIEDAAEQEKLDNILRKRRIAMEIQQQKEKDEQLAAQRRKEALEKARIEREQVDAAVREEQERRRREHEEKVRTQRETLRAAMDKQEKERQERIAAQIAKKREERAIADAVKAAEVYENSVRRAEYRKGQKEMLNQSRAMCMIRTLNDTKQQMEFEAAEALRKEEVERRYQLDLQENARKREKLASDLKKQIAERQEQRMKSQRELMMAQREAAEREKTAAEQEAVTERIALEIKRRALSEDLIRQMEHNLQKQLQEEALS